MERRESSRQQAHAGARTRSEGGGEMSRHLKPYSVRKHITYGSQPKILSIAYFI